MSSNLEYKKILGICTIMILFLTFISIPNSFGHGAHHDTTPSQKLGDKNVTLKFTSSPVYDPDSNAREVSFQLVEMISNNIVKDTVFEIKTTITGEFLFEYVSEKQDDGLLVMEFVPVESEIITIEEKENVTSKEFPNDPKYDLVSVKSNDFDNGGLYFFEVKILEAENTVIDEPLIFFAQIPFPHKTFHDVEDSDFGTQTIRLISYFDKLENFQYEPQTRTLSFEMPFEWTNENINRTSVIHEEITIPKTFGNLMVAEYNAYVNDVQIPEKLITIDEFWTDERLVHIILSHGDLLELKKIQVSEINGMKFVLEPAMKDIPFSAMTENGEFRIIIEPKNFEVGSKAKILFNIFETYPKLIPVKTSYDISISSGDKTIFTHNGRSTDSIDNPNEIEFVIPENSSNLINLRFFEVGDNPFAIATLPVKVLNNDETNIYDNTLPAKDSSQPSIFDEILAFFEKLFNF
ncbi:hypothetical protein [Nitrosarchaeum sp. AC2]|uniref:hypothetical protein n=1 Tax=Nitrosarchaeum sp. AC2 TaxID=2259673 RepID=UPI0015C769D9|nr:hypothetical protein [Nitrosarchaeum sp. AC2]QLH11659.1 hypothetical protein DSQ20_09615 [Nitrosarchaeum sp. AC2]